MRLILFLTAGLSLSRWRASGLLDRELALYRELRAHGVDTAIISYGGREEQVEARLLRGEFTVRYNRLGLPRHLYVRALPWLHYRTLARADLFKANQTDGCEVALRCARVHRKPWVARSGYDWSEFLQRSLPPDAWEIPYARKVEADAARLARAWIFSTRAQRDRLVALHPGLGPRAHILPNYVNTASFVPAPEPKEVDVLWIGRLEPQKNPSLLLEAARLLPGVTLAIVGTGSEESSLKARAEALGVRARWLGNLPHADLPRWMNRARVYVMTSLYEGLPKALLEAMSCGMAVVATDVPGIREVLTDNATGLLRPDAPGAVAEAIGHLLARPDEASRLGLAARAEIESSYALTAVARREAGLLHSLLGGAPP